jgi:hypothetical protein
MSQRIVTPALIDRWRDDRAAGVPFRVIALRDGYAVATVQRYTQGVEAPYRPVEEHRRPHPVNRRPIVSRASGTQYDEPAYLAERPATRLRAKLAEIRGRE